MTGASAWMMTATWMSRTSRCSGRCGRQMTGMMLRPPHLWYLYGAMARRSATGTAGRQVYALTAGYLIVWIVFSLGATALQRGLAELLVVSPMMEVTSANLVRRCCFSQACIS